MKILSALAMTALLFVASPAKADVMVHDPESYETAIGMKVGAALMGLHSSEDDKLVSASSPVCERVEIHTMSEDNGVMKMRKVDGITLPADKIVKLEPSGYHLMLINLKEPLKAGTEFPVTLTFEKAKPETVTVKVLSRSELTKTLDKDAAKTEEHHH